MPERYQRCPDSGGYSHPQRNAGGVRQCRNCADALASARATFCSERCRIERQILAGFASTVRWKLEERDRGICAGCGEDCAANESRRRAIRFHLAAAIGRAGAGRMLSCRLLGIDGTTAWPDMTLRMVGPTKWFADHILPVWKGGGGCGLSGYQTLCESCHASKTKAEATERAARKRATRGIVEPATVDQLGLF